MKIDLKSQQGDLKEMVQFNYQVYLDWFMSNLPPEKVKSLPVTIMHGWRGEEELTIKVNLNINMPPLGIYMLCI